MTGIEISAGGSPAEQKKSKKIFSRLDAEGPKTPRVIQKSPTRTTEKEDDFGQKNLAQRMLDSLVEDRTINVVGKVESTQELNIRGVLRLIPRTDIFCGLVDSSYDPEELRKKIDNVFDSIKNMTQRERLSPALKDAIEPTKGARQYKLVVLERSGSKRRIKRIIGVSVFPDTEIAQHVRENRLLIEAGVKSD